MAGPETAPRVHQVGVHGARLDALAGVQHHRAHVLAQVGGETVEQEDAVVVFIVRGDRVSKHQRGGGAAGAVVPGVPAFAAEVEHQVRLARHRHRRAHGQGHLDLLARGVGKKRHRRRDRERHRRRAGAPAVHLVAGLRPAVRVVIEVPVSQVDAADYKPVVAIERQVVKDILETGQEDASIYPVAGLHRVGENQLVLARGGAAGGIVRRGDSRATGYKELHLRVAGNGDGVSKGNREFDHVAGAVDFPGAGILGRGQRPVLRGGRDRNIRDLDVRADPVSGLPAAARVHQVGVHAVRPDVLTGIQHHRAVAAIDVPAVQQEDAVAIIISPRDRVGEHQRGGAALLPVVTSLPFAIEGKHQVRLARHRHRFAHCQRELDNVVQPVVAARARRRRRDFQRQRVRAGTAAVHFVPGLVAPVADQGQVHILVVHVGDKDVVTVQFDELGVAAAVQEQAVAVRITGAHGVDEHRLVVARGGAAGGIVSGIDGSGPDRECQDRVAADPYARIKGRRQLDHLTAAVGVHGGGDSVRANAPVRRCGRDLQSRQVGCAAVVLVAPGIELDGCAIAVEGAAVMESVANGPAGQPVLRVCRVKSDNQVG